MIANPRWTAPIGALAAVALLFGAVAAGAQDTEAQVARADQVMQRALDDGSNGRSAEACEGAKAAAAMYHNATMSLMSRSMRTDDERREVIAYADWIQKREDLAKELVKVNC